MGYFVLNVGGSRFLMRGLFLGLCDKFFAWLDLIDLMGLIIFSFYVVHALLIFDIC